MDAMGYTPLHVACETGRNHNVRLLLEKAKAALEGKGNAYGCITDEVNVSFYRFGVECLLSECPRRCFQDLHL